MLQDVYLRYRNGCMRLFSMDDQERLVFLGTAFVVHPDGYLLTVSHAIGNHKNLMVVPVPSDVDFLPMSPEELNAMPVHVVSQDKDRDVALLAFSESMEITMPDHVIGVPDAVDMGNGVACLGFAFGFQCIYNQVMQQAVVCAKMRSNNETKLFLFDSRVHDGSRGGPLLNMEDQRVIGIVSGRFDPLEASPATEEERGMPTSFSYAVSIEYAIPLMEEAGLEIL
ncbi:S1 family peptidase [Desulfovibrio oxyclinae]|jgi:serine protease Do|uniref:S1 family peptidase n=1 Tax=Desulfovibrio oxyclinae TaxID=63560 RepID=UPI000368017A|nr:serine protease [Desulfovibrio oxyclinae]